MHRNPHTTLITPEAPVTASTHGGRAKCLQRLIRLDLPVPPTVALSFQAVKRLSDGMMPDISAVVDQFADDVLLCVRPSSEDPDWGGPGAVLNVGMNDARYAALSQDLGEEAAAALYFRFVQSYAIHVARLDADIFDAVPQDGADGLAETLKAYEEEADEAFPQDPRDQLAGVLVSMARAWDGTSARLLRQAKGAPADAGLGLVVQQMIPGLGQSECGSGVLQLINPETGQPQVTGRYLSQSQGREALGAASALYLMKDDRGPSLEDVAPDVFSALQDHAALMRARLREEMQVEFAVQNGRLYILDGVRVPRSSRAAVRIAVALAEDGIIEREEALMRIEPHALNRVLHKQVDPAAQRDVIGHGVAASPGAATGQLVFSAHEAQAAAARDEAAILVRRDTTPEDVRGMHAAVAVLTEKGGMTSHAAVIGRGLGLPCIVGASSLRFQTQRGQIVTRDGRVFREGDVVTLDGTMGEVLAGEPRLIEGMVDEAFQTLMSWADDARDIGIRANADTPSDADTSRRFDAQGIGLCRTEHMFFEPGRLTVMREAILSETPGALKAALERLLPMQRDDFIQLFRIMEGRPVCIRLLDPPLHEFLPTTRSGQRELAEALGLSVTEVTRRVEAMAEYNPMLGLRGVRLGVTMPELYDMQARAIFEATLAVRADGLEVVPEIMIPLVSAKREVELVTSRLDAVAKAVKNEMGQAPGYQVGVMVETPRAALRAGEFAPFVSFLSFGTNDLTQMTYGLSRDDAGRFMSDYVHQGIYGEDPFHVLDGDGVGELLELGVARGRAAKPGLTISICGEHGGNPESIALCRRLGVDYISCSPFRVPVARLAAAQLAIRDKTKA